jgi:acyl-lipid omega-6 desaturase (Delta-12 desaturase)
MQIVTERLMREAAERFVQPNNLLSFIALAFDTALYAASLIVAVMAESFWVKGLASVIAGTAISTLFILGHDANHRSLFTSRRWNEVVSRWTFLPCLHNATLWRLQHNYLHHQFTNVKGQNSFSPLTLEEYRSLPGWRRAVEHLYRSFVGFGMYYLVERWWKHKFIPRKALAGSKRVWAWIDLSILLAFSIAQLLFILWFDAAHGNHQPFRSILFGILIPYLVWNQLMGLTAFLQHTHPKAHWSADERHGRSEATQIEHTTLVQFPKWYDLLSHNIMLHPAHHVSPRIPWHRLRAAQVRLNEIAGADMIIETVGLHYIWQLTSQCRLYDYENHVWLDFAGHPTVHSVDRAQASPI